ncbi:hypothetical protein [Vannielia litorea]|uniref:Uncharacterized protein n=1 Tax=Vannielia litorea TaxID=1217970 RepID=A0A1N6G5Z7_9RHOB|nr:hypothetical protein [Vannielia litorea]SIO02969.1 hypothetical protein SAMN05444002_2233 [Vannielia litorea]
MKNKFVPGLRPAVLAVRRFLGTASVFLYSFLLMGTWTVAQAQSAGVIVVGNDRGGFIRARLNELHEIRERGQRVEIRGKVCFSTCTMYLGLDDVCVSPDTTFGFHGPAMAIGRLTPAQFDYTSRVIASHYPPPVAAWYLEDGRNRISGLYRMKGENLIRLGVAQCDVMNNSR